MDPYTKLLVRSSGNNSAISPKFTGDTQVLAASHEGITLASLCGSGNSGRVKVFLFASCNSHQSVKKLGPSPPSISASYLPRHTSAYSRLTTFALTLVSLRGASPQAPGPKARLRMRRYLISGRYIRPSMRVLDDGSGVKSA